MEDKNKSSQYTFAPEEEQILEILSSFENELSIKLQENKSELEKVKYYEKFSIKNIKDNNIDFFGVFITEEKDAKGRVGYHMYCGDSSYEILSIDAEGNLKIKEGLESYFGDIDLEKLMTENEKEKGKLKGISEKTRPEKLKEKLKDKEQKEEQTEKEENKEEVINKNLEKEDLEIQDYKTIKDERLDEEMQEELKGSDEKGIAYSKKLDAYVLVVRKDGQYQKAEGFEPAKITMKTVYNVNKNGEQIEKKVPHALMETGNEEKEISISLDQYGYVETGMIDKMPTNERVERQLKGQEGKGKNNVVEEKSSELEAMNTNNLNEESLIAAEAAKDKISVPEFKRLLGKVEGTNIIEKIENVHSIIEEQSRPSRTNRN